MGADAQDAARPVKGCTPAQSRHWKRRDEVPQLESLLEPDRVRSHVSRAIAKATIHTDPFPHLVIDKWLPSDVYHRVIDALPPAVFFADRDESRQRLSVPFGVAPAYSRRVWQFVAHVIPPHRDPRWGFVTCLVYLVRPGDNEAHGTQLYRVRDDEEAPSDKPFYVDESRCELVKSVPFRANTMLVFLNSEGAHGASIPADAKPATLERYLYQFRLGPTNPAMANLLKCMPDDKRPLWEGAKTESAQGGGYE